MTREKIKNLVQKAIQKAQKEKKLARFKIPEIQVEKPEDKTHGDYSTNIALQIAKAAKRNPIEIARLLTSYFRLSAKGETHQGRQTSGFLNKVEMVKPGFINFFLSEAYLQKQISEILKRKEKYGQLKIGKNQKVNVEFISANPTGPLHIGNGRGAFFGDCLSNILEKAGYRVIREYYINDAKVNTQIKILGKTALNRGITYLTKDLESKIKILGPKLKKITSEAEAGNLLAKKIQKNIRDFIDKKLKIKFDNWITEEDFYKKSRIKKIYEQLKKKGLTYKKEGAQWLRISKFGATKDEVIIRQTGEPGYFLSDIAYHQDKFKRGFSKIINIWGADHQGHVPRIKAVAKILGYKGDLDVLISQMVRLKRGKISKRKGEIVALEWLINEVGLDAARFFYLMRSLDTQMEFDVELAKERSAKSPVYYVQYAHARISSILRKATSYPPKARLAKGGKLQSTSYNLLTHPSELGLIKELMRFPEVIEDTANDYQVQRIPQYAINLATSFHKFYRDCKVLTKEKGLKGARLGLVSATQNVLKNTLGLMGISAPEKM
ncbi:arginine--tRNA ligase [Patescibacteria group bacterium]|nr:arginine--tRNA ligase [Patescibacteria group bacterium]